MKKTFLLHFAVLLLNLISMRLAAQQQNIDFTGSFSITPAGDCKMISDPTEVRIALSIDTKLGKITGEEFWKEVNGQYEKKENITWTGEALSNKAIRLQQIRTFKCGTVERSETIHYIAVMDASRGYGMKLDARYVMCPSMNCIFDVSYSLVAKAK